jgi:hypothetical protein
MLQEIRVAYKSDDRNDLVTVTTVKCEHGPVTLKYEKID